MIQRITKAMLIRVPALAAGLVLCAIIASGGIDANSPPNADAYFDETAAAINEISYRIGDWNGLAEKVTPAADELLKPNAMVQRMYEDAATGRHFSFLIVHCRDARDMDGHYPPICYENQGYAPVEETRIPIQIEGREATATRYTYLTPDRLRQIEITNFLVVPAYEAPYAPDLEPVGRASRSRASAGLGAAQVQIIFHESIPSRDERDEIIGKVLREVGPALELIARGPRNER
jgi:hypothetical protein